jgi:hypothetical protein
MSTQSVIDGTKIDLSKITFGKITRLSNGSKSVRVSYDGGPLTIQTPMMHIPWGVNPPYSEKDKKEDEGSIAANADGKSKVSKWSLQLSFKGYDSKDTDPNTIRIQQFLEKMKELDQLFLETVVNNRGEWFDDNKKMNKETAEAIYERLYSKSIRERMNKTTKAAYPPSVDPKVNCVDGKFECNVFSLNREKYEKPIDKLNLKGTTGEGIIRLTNFYIQQSRCGPTWTLMRLRANENAPLSDFGFVDFDEEEKEESAPKKPVQIDDSDDEEDTKVKPSGNAEDDSEEEQEEEEEEEEPAPVIKKGAKKPAAPAKKK